MKTYLQQLDELTLKLKDLVKDSEDIREHALRLPIDLLNSYQTELPDGVQPQDLQTPDPFNGEPH
jgi:hypothetical protein